MGTLPVEPEGTPGPAGRAAGRTEGRGSLVQDGLSAAGELPPGPELAGLLESAFDIDPQSWDAATAIGVVQGIWRQVAHLQAWQARALAAMTAMDEYTWCATEKRDDHHHNDRADTAGTPSNEASAGVMARARRHSHQAATVVASELSAAVRVSGKYAHTLVTDAVALVTETPQTWAALAAGHVDSVKARRICDRTHELLAVDEIAIEATAAEAAEHAAATAAEADAEVIVVDETASEAAINSAAEAARGAAREAARAAAWNVAWVRHDRVEAAALDGAPAQTLPQLSDRLRRLIHRADPDAAQRRSTRRREDRRLTPPRPSGDGEATMTAIGPLEDLTAFYTAIDAAARHVRSHGDPRTLDQLRFDLATSAGWTALGLGHLGCCNPTCLPATGRAEAGHAQAGHAGSHVEPCGEIAGHEHAVSEPGGVNPVVVNPVVVIPAIVNSALGRRLCRTRSPRGWLGGHGDRCRSTSPSPCRCCSACPKTRPNSTPPRDPNPCPPPSPATSPTARTRPGDASSPTPSPDPCSTTAAPPTPHRRASPTTSATATAPPASPPPQPPPVAASWITRSPTATGGTTADHNLGAVDPTSHTHLTLHRWRLHQPDPGQFVWTSPAGLTHLVAPGLIHGPVPTADPLTGSDHRLPDDHLERHAVLAPAPANDGSDSDDDIPPF